MGKGDRKTKRGKIVNKSFGKRRTRKASKKIIEAVIKKPKAKATPKTKVKDESTVKATPKTKTKAESTVKATPKTKAKSTVKDETKTTPKPKAKKTVKAPKKNEDKTDKKE